MASPGGGGGGRGGGRGRGFGPPPPPAKPAGGMAGDQADGTAPPLHGSASASAASQAGGTAPPLHGSASTSAAAQAGGTAPPLHGSASGYVGAGVIRPQMRGAAGAGSREVNNNAAAMPDQPVISAAHGNDGTGTGVQVHASTQPAQGVRISNVAHAPPNPPGRHDPSRVVMSQAQTGAGSSTTIGGAQLAQQAIHSQTFLVGRVVERIEYLAGRRMWNVLEGYLREIISTSGSTVDLHPTLLLYCRRGWLIHLLQTGSGTLAIRFHQGYIAPLRRMDSQFADPDEMRSQLDVIWGSITRDPSYTELLASHPGNVVDLIMDYMRLHFPEVVGHTNPPGTTNLFWAFAVHLGRESKKAKLRCVLCQHVMMSDRVGHDMAKHLRQNCPKMTPHWHAKVDALSNESASKKRPRTAARKQAESIQVALPSWKTLISTEAHEAIGTLARLGLNEGAMYHAMILRGELQAIEQLGNEPFFLSGRLEAAMSVLHDLMAAFMLEGGETSPALKELIVRLYKLQFLIPCCLMEVQAYASMQMVQNQAVTVSDSQQQPLTVPSSQQQQQQVVAAPSAVPQEQMVAVQQEPVVATPSAVPQEPVVAAQQELVVVAPLAGEQEQVFVPLVEDQVQNVEEHEHHADQGDDPFNILVDPAVLELYTQSINQFLQEPPPE